MCISIFKYLRGFPGGVLLVAFILIGLISSTDATAQDRTSVTITISKVENVCTYRIQDQELNNQDLFTVKPGWELIFDNTTEGMARVEIGRALQGRHRGKRGVRQDQSNSVDIGAGTSATRNVRGSLVTNPQNPGNQSTRHHVWIMCVSDGEEEPSRPATASIDVGEGGDSIFNDLGVLEFDRSGPAEPEWEYARPIWLNNKTEPILGEGGPDMEVEDP